MLNSRRCVAASIAAAAACLAAGSAHAQLYFSDEDGRAVEFTSPDIPKLTLSSAGQTADGIATLFRQSCLQSQLNPEAIQSVVSTQPWAMVRRDVKIPFTGPAFEPLVPRWLGGGFSLIATPVTIGIPKGSGFRVAGPQCALATGGSALSRAEIEAALSRSIGSLPVNADEAVKKGKPNRNYSPRWRWTGADGVQQDIGVTMMRSYAESPGRLQIAPIPPKTAKAR